MSESRLTGEDILRCDRTAQWLAPFSPGRPIAGVSTDSRTLRPGQLFFALRGEHFDGHCYVRQALERGAIAAVVEQSWAEKQQNGSPLIAVADTLKAFQETARSHRRKFDIPVLAVTGSSGKTTTKEMAVSVLSDKYRVLKSEKSYNNHIGVPATLLQLSSEHDIVVAEMGTNHFGELEHLSYLAEPTLCLFTNIGAAHLEFFIDLNGVARAKMEILSGARRPVTAVLNSDDATLSSLNVPAERLFTYGIDSGELRGRPLEADPMGRWTLEILGEKIKLTLPGRHNLYNALAAAAAATLLSLTPQQIRRGLETVQPVHERLNLSRAGDVLILDDSYNGNPDSFAAAFAAAADISISARGRRIAVLGDMLELGAAAQPEHEKLADLAKRTGIDVLLLHGPLMRGTAERADEIGVLAHHYAGFDDLSDALLGMVKAGDLVLVKGSRAMAMERIVHILTDSFNRSKRN